MQFHPSGFRIAERYEIAGQPLLGGMGIVYLCFDHQEQRPVALKTFRPEYLPDRAARDRFLQEGEAWVRLGRHPHIVRAYSVERIGDGREVFLVLELVAKEEGRRDASLRSWLTAGKPLPVDQALLIALQIARGMYHATETISGFVHRDLKPENVLVGADRLSNAQINRVRVSDFGLVKGLRAEQLPAEGAIDSLIEATDLLTAVGAVVGTPPYIAPEQWEGANVSVQADIYALGCILGEMVIGHMLVQGKDLDELRRAHQSGQALTATRAAPAVLTDLLGRCLAVEQKQRYAGWGAVEEAIVMAYRATTAQSPPGPEAVAALNRAERLAAGWSYSAMGLSYLDLGQAQRALGFFVYAQQVGREEGNHELECAGLGNLGNAYRKLNDVRRAIGVYEQALAIARQMCAASTESSAEWIIGRKGESNALGSLGLVHDALGDPHRAIQQYDQALAIARELGDRQRERNALGNLGIACWHLGDARRAISYYNQALVIDREIGDRRGEGRGLGNLGLAYADLGDAQQAIGYYEQSLGIAQEIGDRVGEGNALGNLGNACLQLGHMVRAKGYFKGQLALARETSDRIGESHALGSLGAVYAYLDNNKRAIGYYEKTLTISQEIGDLNGVASTSLNMAVLHVEQGDSTRALPLAREAARLFTQIGHTINAQKAQQLVAQLERQGL